MFFSLFQCWIIFHQRFGVYLVLTGRLALFYFTIYCTIYLFDPISPSRCPFDYRGQMCRRPRWFNSKPRNYWDRYRTFEPRKWLFQNWQAESVKAWVGEIRWKSTSVQSWKNSGNSEPYAWQKWRHVPGERREDACDHGLSRRLLMVKPVTRWAGSKEEMIKKSAIIKKDMPVYDGWVLIVGCYESWWYFERWSW